MHRIRLVPAAAVTALGLLASGLAATSCDDQKIEKNENRYKSSKENSLFHVFPRSLSKFEYRFFETVRP